MKQVENKMSKPSTSKFRKKQLYNLERVKFTLHPRNLHEMRTSICHTVHSQTRSSVSFPVACLKVQFRATSNAGDAHSVGAGAGTGAAGRGRAPREMLLSLRDACGPAVALPAPTDPRNGTGATRWH